MTMKIDLDLAWSIELGGQRFVIEPLLFRLIEAVDQGGHLKFAASAAGVSYRHAWGLMRTWKHVSSCLCWICSAAAARV